MVAGSSIAQLVDEANRRLAERGHGSVRIELRGAGALLCGPGDRPPGSLIDAGAVVHDLRAVAEQNGVRLVAEFASGGVPTLWAKLTLHPWVTPSRPDDVVWPAGPRVLVGGRATRPLTARELIVACERGAACEGVSVRVAPMPRPEHIGLILRAGAEEAKAWFTLGQTWAGVDRLTRRCGWIAYLRKRPRTAPLRPTPPWFRAQVEVWALRRLPEASSSAPVGLDQGIGS